MMWNNRIIVAMLLPLALTGCRCHDAPHVEGATALPHYAGWYRLVDAAAMGRTADAKQIAQDLTEGPQGIQPGEAAADGLVAVGGAVGFVMMAEDHIEVAQGVAAAASGCGTCHMALGIGSPAPPARWSHQSGARHLVDSLIWTAPMAPPPGGKPPLDALAAAYATPMPRDSGTASDERADRTSLVIAACAACHQSDGIN